MKRNELINVGAFNGTLALVFWLTLGITRDLLFLYPSIGLSLLMLLAFGLSIVAKK